MIEGKMLRNTERGPGVAGFRVGAKSLIGGNARSVARDVLRGD
jgi:hypothetical protein